MKSNSETESPIAQPIHLPRCIELGESTVQRSQTTVGPDRRLIAIAIGLLLALAANVMWIQASNAENDSGDSLEVSVANFCSGDTLAAVLTNTSATPVDAVVSDRKSTRLSSSHAA